MDLRILSFEVIKSLTQGNIGRYLLNPELSLSPLKEKSIDSLFIHKSHFGQRDLHLAVFFSSLASTSVLYYSTFSHLIKQICVKYLYLLGPGTDTKVMCAFTPLMWGR